MRFDVDHADVANALADARRPFDPARVALIAYLSMLAAGGLGALYGAWRAGSALAAAAADPAVGGFANVCREAPQLCYSFLAWAGAVIAAVALAHAIVQGRRKRAADQRREALADSLTSGRFDVAFTADKLVISSAQAIRKIAWANICEIEDAKRNLIFWRRDGGYTFIPKNVVPDEHFHHLLLVRHGAAVNKPCPFEAAHHATPLSVTYEKTRADFDDYFAQYHRERDGALGFLRELYRWPAWTPFLFLIATAIAAAAAYAAFSAASLLLAGLSGAFALAAAAIFLINAAYFRGPAFPFRKNRSWPYAQTDLATVSLSGDGVAFVRHGETDLIRWSAFSGYRETRRYGYLILSATTVIPLPKRAFLCKAHFDDFTAYARQSIAGAKTAAAQQKHGRLMRSIGEKKPQAAPQPKLAAPSAARLNAALKTAQQTKTGEASAPKSTQPTQPVKKPAAQKSAPAAKADPEKPAAPARKQSAA